MTYSPPRVGISAITQANPCVITTDADHNLITGQIVRIHVPKNYGMIPLNNRLFSVTVLSDTTLSLQVTQIPPAINVNSTDFPAFTVPANPQFTAEVVPVGSGPTPITNTPVQALNNVCDDLLADAAQNIALVNQPY